MRQRRLRRSSMPVRQRWFGRRSRLPHCARLSLDPTGERFLDQLLPLACAAYAGDTQARELIERSARYLGHAAVTMSALFDLDTVVLAGPSFTIAGSIYQEIVQEEVADVPSPAAPTPSGSSVPPAVRRSRHRRCRARPPGRTDARSQPSHRPQEGIGRQNRIDEVAEGRSEGAGTMGGGHGDSRR